jgi:hypothetical protein
MQAVLFCLETQYRLLESAWPAEVLSLPSCKEVTATDGSLLFRGPRVRMGIHWAGEGTVAHRYFSFNTLLHCTHWAGKDIVPHGCCSSRGAARSCCCLAAQHLCLAAWHLNTVSCGTLLQAGLVEMLHPGLSGPLACCCCQCSKTSACALPAGCTC